MTYQEQVNEALGLPADASADQAIESVRASEDAAVTSARDEGRNAENARVTAILSAVAEAPHARGIADAAIAQGLSAEQAQAMIAAMPAPVEPSAEGREEFRQALQDEGRQQAAPAPSATGADGADDDGSDGALRAKWDGDTKLRAEFSNDFARYQAFQKAQASGRVRILKG